MPSVQLAERTLALQEYNSLTFALSQAASKMEQGIEVVDFGGGKPPHKVLQEITGPAIAEIAQQIFSNGNEFARLLNYSGPEAYPPFAESIRQHLKNEIKIDIPPHRILVTSGLQEGLDLVARSLTEFGDVILTETPTYPGALQAWSIHDGIQVWGVETDEQGMTEEGITAAANEAKKQGRKIKFAYLLNEGNPDSSKILSEQRGKQILELSLKHNFGILQDDAYNGLIYNDSTPCPPLIKHNKNVMFGRTMSKTLAPGLRLAWLVLPDELMPAIKGIKARTNLTTSRFFQAISAEYMASGKFESNLVKIKYVYDKKRKDMLNAIAGQKIITTKPIHTSMFAWANNSLGVDTLESLNSISNELNIAYLPGIDCYPKTVFGPSDILRKAKTQMRLNFTSPPNKEVVIKGINLMSEKFEQLS